MIFIKVVKGIITEVLASCEPIKGYTQVPDDFSGCVNERIDLFDAKFQRRKLSTLVKAGLIEVPFGMTLKGESFVDKTIEERVATGEVAIPPTHKLVNGVVVPKSITEQVADGTITLDEHHELVDDLVVLKTDLEYYTEHPDEIDDDHFIYNGEYVAKTIYDRYASGELPVPKMTKVETDQDGKHYLRSMTTEEGYAAGHLTKDEAYERLCRESRNLRDSILSACDWTQAIDAPLNEKAKKKWQEYRQELRDITEQKDYPWSIKWPRDPNGVEL